MEFIVFVLFKTGVYYGSFYALNFLMILRHKNIPPLKFDRY